MVAEKPKNDNFLYGLAIGFGIVLAIGLLWSYFSFKRQVAYYQNRIYPQVFLDTVNFGGKTTQELQNYYSQKSQQLSPLQIEVLYKGNPIATFSAEKLKVAYNSQEMSTAAFAIGHSSNNLFRFQEQLANFFRLKEYRLPTIINYDKSSIQEFIENSEQKYNLPARNALFKFENGKVVQFRKETLGLKISSESFLKEFDELIFSLKVNPNNKKISLIDTIIEPEITLEKANDYGIVEEIAIGKSNYSHSIPERIHNVILAASKFDGVLIPKNKVFSFNDAIGDISSSTGYQPAYIIKAGKTVLGDGGGVCQVSTTLFRAALNAGLPIVERNAHAYRVGYYENDSGPGFDATVFSPTADLKIENNTPAYILIQTEIDKNKNLLYFHFYGKKDGRKVDISPVTIFDIQPALPDVHQDDPTIAKGTTKQVDFAAPGAKTTFNYEVTLNGQTLTQRKFYSNYRPWAAVYLVGTKE